MTQYVFDPRDVVRYRYPTHTNDLILDRADGTAAEAFFVILEPGEAPPLHVHPDAEQVFFILEGVGEMGVGPGGAEKHPLKVGDFVRTPPGVPHSVRCLGDSRFVYLSIDCFTNGPDPDEPTWDSHVRQMCIDNGWEFDRVKLGAVDPASHALGPRMPGRLPAREEDR